ncbi:MAG: hypothetical protein WDM76_08795 [Limisphaerales bacterium]
MKSIRNLILTSLIFFAILCGIIQGHSQTTLILDSKKPWQGYMNVFDLGNNYAFGQPWAGADLRAFF